MSPGQLVKVVGVALAAAGADIRLSGLPPSTPLPFLLLPWLTLRFSGVFGETLEGWKELQLIFAPLSPATPTPDHPWGSPNLLQVPLSKDEDPPA